MQVKKTPRSNQSRTEATRSALIKAARALFALNGYAETSTPDIVAAAGVTRGALYHHFEDKLALFNAVVVSEHEAVAEQIMESADSEPTTAFEALCLGSRGYLAAMREEGRVQIMLIDGPAVLGRAALDQIDAQTSTETLREGLANAMEAGDIRELPLNALTVQLSALYDRAALAVSEGDSEADHLAVLDALFAALIPN